MRARFMMCAVAGLCLAACYEDKEPTTSSGYLGKGGFGYVCDLGVVAECTSGTVPLPSSVAAGSTFSIRYEANEDEQDDGSRTIVITSGRVESVGSHLSSDSSGHFKALSAGSATLVLRGVNHDLIDYHPLNIEDVAELVLGSFSNRDRTPELLSSSAVKSVPPGTYQVAVYPTSASGEKLNGIIAYEATSSNEAVVSIESVDGRYVSFVAHAPGKTTLTISGSQTSVSVDIDVTGGVL